MTTCFSCSHKSNHIHISRLKYMYEHKTLVMQLFRTLYTHFCVRPILHTKNFYHPFAIYMTFTIVRKVRGVALRRPVRFHPEGQ